jgi:hypothetical protein
LVRLAPTHFDVVVGMGEESRCGLVDLYRLRRLVAAGLMDRWHLPRAAKGPVQERHPRQWALEKTRGAISARLYQQWQRHLISVDPTVLAVHRAVFAATCQTAEVTMCEEFYRHRHVVTDVIRYRAAAAASVMAVTLTVAEIERQVFAIPQAVRCDEWKALRAVVHACRSDLPTHS